MTSWFLPAYFLAGHSKIIRGHEAFLLATLLPLLTSDEPPEFPVLMLLSPLTNALFLGLPFVLRDGSLLSRRLLAVLYSVAFLINAGWVFLKQLVLLNGFLAWWLSFAVIAVGLFLGEHEAHLSERVKDGAV